MKDNIHTHKLAHARHAEVSSHVINHMTVTWFTRCYGY